MAQLAIEMTADEAKLWAAVQRALAQQESYEAALKRTTQESMQAARASEGLARWARRAFEDAKPAQDRYNERMAGLQELLNKNRISQEQFGAASKKAADDLARAAAEAEKNDKALQKVDASTEKAARASQELAAWAKRAFEEGRPAVDRYNERLAKLQDLLNKGEISQEEFAAGAKKAADALEQERQAAEKNDPAIKKANEETQKLIRADQELATWAKRAFEEGRPAVDRYTERLARLKDLLDKGEISQEEFAAGSKRAADALEQERQAAAKNDPAIQKMNEETQKAARANQELATWAKRAYEEGRPAMERHKERLQQLNGLLTKGEISQKEYAAAAKKSADEVQRAAQGGLRAFGSSALGDIKSYATGMLSAAAAVHAVTSALRDQAEQERKAHAANLGIADWQAEAIANLAAASDEEQAAYIDRVEKVAAKTKPVGGRATAYRVSSSALSASGSDVDIAMPATEVALMATPQSPEAAELTAAALADLGAKVTGTNDATANLGYLLGVGKTSHAKNLKALSEHVTKGIIGVYGYGGTAQEAGALVSAMTQGMADVEGRESGTAAIQLSKQLSEFLNPESGESKPMERLHKEIATAEEKLKDLEAKPGMQAADRRRSIEDRLSKLRRQAESATGKDAKRIVGQIRTAESELAAIGESGELKPSDVAERDEVLAKLAKLKQTEAQKTAEDTLRRGEWAELTSTRERIDYLRAHPELVKEFFSKEGFGASFEAKAQVPVEQVFGLRGGQTGRFFDQFQKEIAPAEKSRSLAEDFLKLKDRPFEQRLAARERLKEGAIEEGMTNPAGKEAAIAGGASPADLDRFLASRRVGWIDRTWAWTQLWANYVNPRRISQDERFGEILRDTADRMQGIPGEYREDVKQKLRQRGPRSQSREDIGEYERIQGIRKFADQYSAASEDMRKILLDAATSMKQSIAEGAEAMKGAAQEVRRSGPTMGSNQKDL